MTYQVLGVVGVLFVSAGGLVLMVGFLVSLVLSIWAIGDAVSRPTGAFLAASSSRGMWIALIALTWLFTGIVGLVLAIVYLVSIRPRVKAVMA